MDLCNLAQLWAQAELGNTPLIPQGLIINVQFICSIYISLFISQKKYYMEENVDALEIVIYFYPMFPES